MCVCVCVVRQHFLINTYLVKQYRRLLSTYFYFDPLKLSDGSYIIRLELANQFSKVNLFPSILSSIEGHLQEVYILQKQYNLCTYNTAL